MNLSHTFVKRPIFAGVLSVFVLIAGLLAIPNLPVGEYPEVVPPTIQVTATYPGANPKTISETVAAPLEEAINGVENMIYMKSVASSDGQLQVQVTFKGGTDIDLASVQVQNRVQAAMPRLPEEVKRLGVKTKKKSPDFAALVCLYSPEGRYDALYLNNYAVLRLKDVLARTPGLDEAGGEVREDMAREIAQRSDLVIFVIDGDITDTDLRGAGGGEDDGVVRAAV